MSSFHFSRKQTISKQSGPVYINTYALSGIGVRYTNPTSSIQPVSLPTGWRLPNLVDNYTVSLDLENQVLEQTKAHRQAIAGEVPDPNASLNLSSLARDTPLIPYQSSAILTPIPVGTPSSSTAVDATEPTTKLLGEMSLRDFEGDTNDPFETTSLQAIDVYSELQSVLQPELTATSNMTTTLSGHDCTHLSSTSGLHPQSPSNLSTTPPYQLQPVNQQQPPSYSTSDKGTSENIAGLGSGNIVKPLQAGTGNNIRPLPGGVGVLVDFGRPNQPILDVKQ